MTATIDQIAYGTSTAITWTPGALASSATVGRGCAAVDNTVALADDALLTVNVIAPASGTLANDKACYVYLFGTEDGTNYSASSAEAVGTDASVTVDVPSGMKGPFVIPIPVVGVTYRGVWSVAQAFGGVMPRKWGFVLVNYCGLALTTGSTATYTGITYTNT